MDVVRVVEMDGIVIECGCCGASVGFIFLWIGENILMIEFFFFIVERSNFGVNGLNIKGGNIRKS